VIARRFLAFAAAFFVLHQIGSVLAVNRVASAIDLLTPFAVVATSAALLVALDAGRDAIVAALIAGTMYVHALGAHVAANSIHGEGIDADVVYFWDERFSHIEGALGWFGLIAAFCLAERGYARREGVGSPAALAAGALLLGWTLFTSTVEGQTWWLELPTAALFGAWAARAPRPLLRAAAGAFLLGAVLIAAWAAWHGGVPEFSDL
jgi:hypothetical protein